MRKTLEARVACLEQRQAKDQKPRKRAVPDWLQVVYEASGFVFDAAGQVISAPPLCGISETPSVVP